MPHARKWPGKSTMYGTAYTGTYALRNPLRGPKGGGWNEKAALWARLDSVFNGLTPTARYVGRQARSLLHLGCGHLVLDRFTVVALHAILVANHLPVELVDQCVDSGIQVFMMRFDKDVLALEM